MSLAIGCMGPLAANAADTVACGDAGPRTEFCGGAIFSRLDDGSAQGVSFWLHRTGFMSKILVQEVQGGNFSQGDIEGSILEMVSSQANAQGRAFTFSDIEAANIGGQPFGTLSYAFSREGGEQAILHSYVSTGDLILQIISQIGLSSASSAPDALEKAHAAALHALVLTDAGPEA